VIPFIANHLWQSTLFTFLIALIAVCLRHSQARFRYWLWLSASVKFLVPFALLIAFGRHLQWPASRNITPVAVSTAVTQVSEPFLMVKTSPVNGMPVTRRAWSPAWRILPYIWLAGCMGVVAIRIRQWRRIRRAIASSAPQTLPKVDLPSNVVVRSTSQLLEPGVVGLWRPILLLPAGLRDHLTEAQLQAVVAHEATHIRRRDNFTASIHMTTEALFWFHPLVWWIGGRLLAERERACDEEVLRLFGDPEAYASGILAICKRYVETPLRCVSGVSGSNIRKRLEAIMSNHIGARLSFTVRIVLAMTAVAVIALPLAIGSISSLQAQSAGVQTNEKFTDATIQPCLQEPTGIPGQRGSGANSLRMTSGRSHVECMTLATLVRTAYGYGPAALELTDTKDGENHPLPMHLDSSYGLGREDGTRVRGGPDWVRSDRYIIDATTAASATADQMRGPMLLDLLEHRFQLQAHIESENVPGFALTLAGGGFKISPAADGECAPGPVPAEVVAKRNGKTSPVLPAEAEALGVKPTCGVVYGDRDGANWRFQHVGQPDLRGVAFAAADALGVRVVDRTGLKGPFTLTWEYRPDESTPHSLEMFQTVLRDADSTGSVQRAPILRDALAQLGLQLQPIQVPREYVVIDHVARPSN
jgi:uncharacterized protein (TIGR03435 family)